MPGLPVVDVNLFVHNAAATVAAAIESVLAQTWPALTLTLIDDGSTDGTAEILADYASRHDAIRLKRNRVNGGAIANFQRAFWFGDADFVLPKSGDDLIAADFIERTMTVLLDQPQTVMCHAAGLVFTGESDIRQLYPAAHRLHATGADRLARARTVMAAYTSSPSFWGVYRRAAVDLLSPIRYRAGWDHVVLAELSLHGEIRHVPEPLYWRRDGGKPVLHLARASTEQATRRLPLEGPLAEQRWRTPLITTAFAHLETFAATRLPEPERLALMRSVPPIFRDRWLAAMRQEAAALRQSLPALLEPLGTAEPLARSWIARTLSEAVQAVLTILPEEDFAVPLLEIAAAVSDLPRAA